MLLRLFSLPCLLALLGFPSGAQEAQHWTERRNLGFEGPVRSALTTVVRPNPDPRPPAPRSLVVQANPDWAAFDTQGRRIEFASVSSLNRIEAISKCTFQADGVEACTDSTDGRTTKARKEDTTLPDGSREVKYLRDSKVDSREVTRFDEKGNVIGSSTYGNTGKLISEGSTLPNGDEESKIYDESGRIVSTEQTHNGDGSRFDRWSYDPEGQPVWHLAINGDGEVLSYWYKVGYKPKLSSSGSLGICRTGLCVSYKFDEQGSARMEKVVQHTSREGNIEPDSEEHYNLEGVLDEKVEIKYVRDAHGNWTARTVFVWDAATNMMIEVERDERTIRYY